MKSHVIALKNLVLVALTVVIPVLSASAQTPTPSPFSSDESTQTPPITVVGQPVPLSGGTVVVPTPDLQASATDTASLLEQVPGAAVARNGPLTGIAQLRGLSDDRVGVLVNGMQITPACPNHMDPPLLYIAPSQLHSLTVLPGITPVSLGGDNIGGMVLTEPKPPGFARTPNPLFTSELSSFYRVSNDGVGVKVLKTDPRGGTVSSCERNPGAQQFQANLISRPENQTQR